MACGNPKSDKKPKGPSEGFWSRMNPFKGQKGQDKWVIFTVLPFKRRGFFLDLAAADGVLHSNTYALEKVFGWKGICVEPNPSFLETLKKKRKCIVDGSVVSNKRERVTFRADNGVLGGIVADDTDNSPRVRGDQLASAETMEFDAILLSDLLERHSAPSTIDYFSLDVEGCEERIISSIDFDKYKFLCLTIERPTPKVNEILFDNGYVFVKNYQFDSFYIHPSLKDKKRIVCEEFEQVPTKEW
jgi:FkbM family methyltransferase